MPVSLPRLVVRTRVCELAYPNFAFVFLVLLSIFRLALSALPALTIVASEPWLISAAPLLTPRLVIVSRPRFDCTVDSLIRSLIFRIDFGLI